MPLTHAAGWQNFVTVLVIALAVASVSVTLTRTKIVMKVQEKIKAKSVWFGNLVTCPYCFSHWLTFGAIAIYRPVLIHLWWPLDLLVTAFVSITISAWFFGLILKAMTIGVAPPKAR